MLSPKFPHLAFRADQLDAPWKTVMGVFHMAMVKLVIGKISRLDMMKKGLFDTRSASMLKKMRGERRSRNVMPYLARYSSFCIVEI